MDKLKLASGKHRFNHLTKCIAALQIATILKISLLQICSAAVQVRLKLFKIYSNGN